MLSCSGLCFAKNMIENEKNNLIGESNTYKMMSFLLQALEIFHISNEFFERMG